MFLPQDILYMVLYHTRGKYKKGLVNVEREKLFFSCIKLCSFALDAPL